MYTHPHCYNLFVVCRCDERVYGYYVDTENSCQVFHVCYPYVDVDLLIKVRMFSFICGEGLVFDQSRLVRNEVLTFSIIVVYTWDYIAIRSIVGIFMI